MGLQKKKLQNILNKFYKIIFMIVKLNILLYKYKRNNQMITFKYKFPQNKKLV